MTNTLDFRKREKNFLTLVFDDQAKTELSIRQPTKSLFESMILLGSKMSSTSNMVNEPKVLDEVYELAAQLISFNKQNYLIDGTSLAELLDFEDLVIFLEYYSKFVQESISKKN